MGVLVVSSFPWKSACADDGGLKETLQSKYAAMKTAIAARDSAAIAAMLAPDFQSIGVSGQSETASQMITDVNTLEPDPDKVSTTTLTSVKSFANEVTVEQQYDMKTVKAAANGVTHHIELITLSTDTWVKAESVWLLKRTITDELSYFRDGQLVVHKVKPQ